MEPDLSSLAGMDCGRRRRRFDLAGLVQAAAGEPTTVTRVLTIIFPTVITLWLVEMNILVLRKAPALERAITQDP